MTLHKIAIPVLALLATAIAAPPFARAQSPYSYPYCAVYPRAIGGYACYYKTYESCMKTMMIGIGGSCMVSPFYRGPAAASSPISQRPRRGRHS
jgi:hypothetical protein